MKPERRIILAGGSGFLGRALEAYFGRRGWRVVVLRRNPTRPDVDVLWDAKTSGAWAHHVDAADVIVNLTGRSVNCRYGARNRAEILNSRVDSTRVLGEVIARCERPPHVWINSSTATIYQHTFGPPHDETGSAGATPEAKDAFSIEVAQAWERALALANTPATRKVALRSAMVLGHAQNSVFPVLRRLARFGLGGKMGSGQQFVSWVHQTDFCRAIEWIIDHEELNGVINVAAPQPIPNSEMMRELRAACGAKFGLPATAWMLEVGAFFLRTETELILKSRRVISRRLAESGFNFEFREMRAAFENLVRD